MKICYLADGLSSHTQKWVSFFANRNHEIHLITFRKTDIPKVIIHDIKITIPILMSHVAPIYTKIGYLFYLNKVKKIIQKIAPDLVHAHWATSYGLLGAYSGFHPFLVSSWGRDIYKASEGSFFYKKIINYTLNKADYITATSKVLVNETAKYIHESNITIHQVPFGVDIEQFNPLTEKSTEDFTTIGLIKKLEPFCGIEYLIKAFAISLKKLKHIRLLIVGDGSQRKHLEKLSQGLNIYNSISFIGEIPHEEVVKYYNKIDIFVIPSLIESFGVVAIEASACGIPVVASDVGGLPEVVIDGKTGFLVPPKNPEAIAEKILLLATDSELRMKMGQMARKFVEGNYVWEENALEMERLYQMIINKK